MTPTQFTLSLTPDQINLMGLGLQGLSAQVTNMVASINEQLTAQQPKPETE